MPSTTTSPVTVREISAAAFSAFLQGKDVNPMHALGLYNRMLEHQEQAAIYGGYVGDDLKIAMITRIVPAWKVFSWLYAPLGFVMEDYDDFHLIQAFMEGLQPLMKKKNVMYFRMESDMELTQRDQNGEEVPDGYSNRAWREGMESIGFQLSPLTRGYDMSRQTRWASLIDLVEYKDGRNGRLATPAQLADFDAHFVMKSEDELLKAMELKTRQSLKLASRPYIQVRPLAYEELSLLSDLEKSAAEHHGFHSNSFGMDQAMYKGYGDDCEVLYAWLDVQAYVDYMQKQYDEAKANYDLRQEKYEQSPGRRNKKALHTAQQDLEAAEKKIQEARTLQAEPGDEIPLSAAMFLTSPTETIYMTSGSNRDFMRFAGAYAIQWTAIRKALARKALRYNFWGISGIFDPEDPSYGVFAFKRGFNARVTEYVGEFTWVFMPAMTRLYLKYLDRKGLQENA